MVLAGQIFQGIYYLFYYINNRILYYIYYFQGIHLKKQTGTEWDFKGAETD